MYSFMYFSYSNMYICCDIFFCMFCTFNFSNVVSALNYKLNSSEFCYEL